MNVVGHEAEAVDHNTKSSSAFFECGEEKIAVIIRKEYVLSFVAAREDMIKSSGVLDPKRAGHQINLCSSCFKN